MKNRVLTRQPSAHGRTGDVLDEEQAQAAREEDVFSSLSEIGVRFRTRIANSRQPSKSESTPAAAQMSANSFTGDVLGV
jgi:hypothetical protein